MKFRKSKQRDKIFKLLQETTIHPTASWIYDKLKKEFPNLSLGTVYRNLNILIEQGLVKEIDFGSTFDRYEANVKPHYHFICESCGCIIDINLPIISELNNKVDNLISSNTKRHRIEFFGLCKECKSKKV